MRFLGVAALTFAVPMFLSCSSTTPAPADPPCVQGLSASCQAEYDPATYATIFTKILQPTCGTGGASCHAAAGAKAGLVFEDADRAYGMLLGRSGARARVVPGDPSCSLIMKRLTSQDPSYHMPPGSESLSPGALCTITKWIAAGAAR